jgi:hypothetical protein
MPDRWWKKLVKEQVQGAMSLELLRHVRDDAPLQDDLLTWLSERQLVGSYHILRKEGVLLLEQGRVVISSEYLTPDKTGVYYENQICWLDRDQIDVF